MNKYEHIMIFITYVVKNTAYGSTFLCILFDENRYDIISCFCITAYCYGTMYRVLVSCNEESVGG